MAYRAFSIDATVIFRRKKPGWGEPRRHGRGSDETALSVAARCKAAFSFPWCFKKKRIVSVSFEYSMPTRVVSGAGCLIEKGSLLRGLGTKALIVTGAHSARASGALDDAVRALDANGQAYALFDGVMNNPGVDCVCRGAELLGREGCDFVLAIGGGSPMDAGKAMALLAAADTPVSGAEMFAASWSRALPVAAVPTTAGTGSEVTPYAVLTNEAAETKTNVSTPLIFPRLAFLDAAYTRDLSGDVTVNTAVDALSHAVEGMLTVRSSQLTDSLAGRSIAMIASCLPALREEDPGMPARETLLYASTLAGMVIANTGTTAVHGLGYSLTYYKGVAHGRANGLLLPGFLAFVAEREPERVRAILACMGMAAVGEFARLMRELLGECPPLEEDEIRRYAEKASKARSLPNCLVRPDRADLEIIIRSALSDA